MSECFVIDKIEATSRHQIIVTLKGERTGADGPGDGTQYVVRITVDEAATIVRDLFDAYARALSELAIDVAAGGCRTCGNERRVNRALFDFTGTSGDPCPVCVPRAVKRIKDKTFTRNRDV